MFNTVIKYSCSKHMMQLSLWFCAFIGSMLYSLVLLDYGSTQNVKMIDEIINSQQVDKKKNVGLQYNVNWSVPHRTSMFLSTLSLCVRTLSVLIHIIMDVFIELNICVWGGGGGSSDMANPGLTFSSSPPCLGQIKACLIQKYEWFSSASITL